MHGVVLTSNKLIIIHIKPNNHHIDKKDEDKLLLYSVAKQRLSTAS